MVREAGRKELRHLGRHGVEGEGLGNGSDSVV